MAALAGAELGRRKAPLGVRAVLGNHGHIVESKRGLIVSGGVGCAILPARIGVPPEVVLADVGAA